MKLGLFGGSFDPIHRGHLEPVLAACEALGLDRVLFLPTANPPHKPRRAQASPWARFAMVELALLGHERLFASAHELTLDRPAYTVETLEHFRRELPDADLYLIVGGDSFADLPHWVRFREIPRLAQIVVLARPGWDLDAARLDPEMAALARSDRVSLLGQPEVGVSSTQIRSLLAAGEPLPVGAVPEMVVRYIAKYDLYR
jgi:nicotinate-nucleotide adenylyltransferase